MTAMATPVMPQSIVSHRGEGVMNKVPDLSRVDYEATIDINVQVLRERL